MVVQCQHCRARFRVADEKVGDRGVRVRCTGCRTVLVIQRDGSQVMATQQAATGDTYIGPPPSAAALQQAAAAQTPAVRAPQPLVTPAPPRNGAPPRPRPPDDDPFGMAELTGEPSRPAPTQPPAPPQAARPPPGLRPRSSVGLPAELDLDLAGGPPPTPPAPAPRSVPPPPSRAARPSSPPPAGQQPAPTPSKPPPPPPLFDDDADEPARPAATNGAPGPQLAAEPPPPAPGLSGAPGALPSSLRDPFADIQLDSNPGVPRTRGSEPFAPGSEPARNAPSERPPAQHGSAPHRPAQPLPVRSVRRQIVSAALTGLSLAAAGALVVIGPSSFLDGGLRRLLRLGRSDLVAVQEASGLYDTVGGRPVFFVRGRIENHGKRPSGPVRVVATLLSEAGPTARAEGVAGAEPSAEDVYLLRSPAEADKLVRTLAQRNARDRLLPPGGSLPFFALFSEPPGDLSGQHVQLRLESADVAAAAR